jgi:hypothetical protein
VKCNTHLDKNANARCITNRTVAGIFKRRISLRKCGGMSYNQGMANRPNASTKSVSARVQTSTPISQHFGGGERVVPGTSIRQIENLNRGQSDRAVKRNPTDSTNQRVIQRPVSGFNTQA